MRQLILAFFLIFLIVGCESTRKREEERRSQLEYYTYTYSMKRNQYGLKKVEAKDKNMLSKLEREGWILVREDRDTQGDTDVITAHYER